MTRVTQRQLDAHGYLHANGLHEKGASAAVANFACIIVISRTYP